jgi:hypothetical protein
MIRLLACCLICCCGLDGIVKGKADQDAQHSGDVDRPLNTPEPVHDRSPRAVDPLHEDNSSAPETGPEERGGEHRLLVAPVRYEDTMLVLHDDRGAAAVRFDRPFDELDEAKSQRHVVTYQWRYLPQGGEERTGTGAVYEYLSDRDRGRSDWIVEAGPLWIIWSHGDAEQGWYYYDPTHTAVHPVNRNWFAERRVPHNPQGKPRPPLNLAEFLAPDKEAREWYRNQDYEGPVTQSRHARSPLTAKIDYADIVLIVATPDGVAAFRFETGYTDDDDRANTRRGVRYTYRYTSNDGVTVRDGEGEVYELYINGQYQNKGTLHYLEAGPVHLAWSRGGQDSGWIYFDPAWHSVWFIVPDAIDEDNKPNRQIGDGQWINLSPFRLGGMPSRR